jgi:hypothetical protein
MARQAHFCSKCGRSWKCEMCFANEHRKDATADDCPRCSVYRVAVSDAVYRANGATYQWGWEDDFAEWVAEVRGAATHGT